MSFLLRLFFFSLKTNKKMKESETNSYSFFVGIDMSKLKFDVAIIDKTNKKIGHRHFENSSLGFEIFAAWVLEKTQSGPCLFCMEFTGIYSRKLWHYIQDRNWHLWMQSGYEIKCKAGIRKTKTDKADAFMIAQYALSNSFSAVIDNIYDENIELLHDLLSARNRLISAIQRLKKPLQEMEKYGGDRNYKILDAVNTVALNGLEAALKQLNEQIDILIKDNPAWQENIDLACSIKGVGKVVCLWILVYSKNFNSSCNARKFASLAGVAPFTSESGSSIRNGSHTNHFSHKFLKGILHTAAMSAIMSNTPIKTYFNKKKAEGKKGFLAMNNVKNKLIQQIFAVVKSKIPFDNEYKHPKAA